MERKGVRPSDPRPAGRRDRERRARPAHRHVPGERAEPGRSRASGKERRPARADHAVPGGRAADATARAARRRGGPVQGGHDLPRRGRVLRDHRRAPEDGGGRRAAPAALGHDRRAERGARQAPGRIQDRGRGQPPPHGARHQEGDGRGPRLTGRLAPRALLGPAVLPGPQHRDRGERRRDGSPGRRPGLPALRPRHRRSRQPRGAGPVREGVRDAGRLARRALAHRARPAPPPAGHPTLRPAGRDRLHAGRPPRVGCSLRGGPPGRRSRPRRGLRLAQPPRRGGDRDQRNRHPGRRHRSPPHLLRVGDPPAVRRDRPSIPSSA